MISNPTLTTEEDAGDLWQEMLRATMPRSRPTRPLTLAATVNFSWMFPHRTYPIDLTPPPVPVAGAIVTLTWKRVGAGNRWQVTLDVAHQIKVRVSPSMGRNLNTILHSRPAYGLSSSCPVLFLCATYFELDDAIAVANALDAAIQPLFQNQKR